MCLNTHDEGTLKVKVLRRSKSFLMIIRIKIVILIPEHGTVLVK